MRVADKTTARNYLKYLNNAKTNYAKTNKKISSGNRFQSISEDVSAGTRVLRTRADMTKADEYVDNIKNLKEQLTSTEDAMMAINDVIGKAHSQKILKALNGATGADGLDALANEIASMKKEVLGFANSMHYNRYVLGGTRAEGAPFTVNSAGELEYNGINVDKISKSTTTGKYVYDDGGTETPIPMDNGIFYDIGLGVKMNGSEVDPDTAFNVAFSGMDILGCGVDGKGNSKNLYSILSDVETAIRDNNMNKLEELDDLLVSETDRYRSNITNIGAKTNYLDTLLDKMNNNVDSYKAQVFTLMGVNDAEEATNQTMNDYVLKAVLKMGANVLPVSLMSFMN